MVVVKPRKDERIGFKRFHDWLIPSRVVLLILSAGVCNVIVGTILLIIGRGSALGNALGVWGAVLLGIGLCLILICLLLCLHACFVHYEKDAGIQVGDPSDARGVTYVDGAPPYAVIHKGSPSSMKRVEASPRMTGPKKVTMAPGVDPQGRERMIPVQQSPADSSTKQPISYPIRVEQYPYYTQPNSYQYPLQPSQATPYSSLGKPPQTSTPVKPVRGYGSPFEDYDNANEMSPMMHPSQQTWRPANVSRDEPPEPQPLVYPSARRPMTFEQVSSSKMSIYDNLQFPYGEELQ